MLLVNGLIANTVRCNFIGGKAGAVRTAFGEADIWVARTSAMNKTASVPSGYRGGIALVMGVQDGGMAAKIIGSCGVSGAVSAAGILMSTLTGSANIDFANLAGGLNASAVLTGSGSLSAPLNGFGNLTCSISIGARPSAVDIAQAVWEELLTGHTTPGTAAKKLKDVLTKSEFIGLQ